MSFFLRISSSEVLFFIINYNLGQTTSSPKTYLYCVCLFNNLANSSVLFIISSSLKLLYLFNDLVILKQLVCPLNFNRSVIDAENYWFQQLQRWQARPGDQYPLLLPGAKPPGGGGRSPPTPSNRRRSLLFDRKSKNVTPWNKFSNVWKRASAAIHVCKNFENRVSRKPSSQSNFFLKLCTFCLQYISRRYWNFQVSIF